MSARFARIRRAGPAAAGVLLAVVIAGCFNPFAPRIAPVRGTSSPPPVPNSATEVVRLFDWCWDNRSYDEYREIFTADYFFQYTTTDSAGQVRGDFYNRDTEMDIARHLFIEGTASEPPARSITLELNANLSDDPDTREGKNPKWHRMVVTDVVLRIDNGETTWDVQGKARFYVVRGDSAAIPDELKDRFKPDSTRWWIEFWADETIGDDNTGGAARPPRIEIASVRRLPAPMSAESESYRWSWAGVKTFYRR